MHDDAARYWRDLTENYAGMSDGELLELAETPEDLTDVAQQALRDEMGKRRLTRKERRTSPAGAPSPDFNPGTHFEMPGGLFPRYHGLPPESEEADDSDTREYTWKTLLCDCESNEDAWQLFQWLKRQGIESWVRQVSPSSTDIRGPQVYVAADQLEQARAIAAQPIPQDIIDESNEVVPEFEVPACPRCGSKDGPVLESADPVNSWLCESCGAEWTDPELEAEKPPAP